MIKITHNDVAIPLDTYMAQIISAEADEDTLDRISDMLEELNKKEEEAS